MLIFQLQQFDNSGATKKSVQHLPGTLGTAVVVRNQEGPDESVAQTEAEHDAEHAHDAALSGYTPCAN